MLFTYKQRIRREADFKVIFKKGKRLSISCFAFSYLNTEREYSRLGIIIQKKYCALASHRNRLRRLVREQFRLNQQQLPSIDLVVSLKSNSTMSDQEHQICLKHLFSELISSCNGLSSN